MITHLVLLEPRPDLPDAMRRQALELLSHSASNIPDIRRVRIGRRVKHGLPGYEQSMSQGFEYVLLFEFDDVDALKRYLQAPAHGMLGQLFSTATSAALAYDFEVVEATEALSLL
jgi:stress responsive alpha/beta barrel protein